MLIMFASHRINFITLAKSNNFACFLLQRLRSDFLEKYGTKLC